VQEIYKQLITSGPACSPYSAEAMRRRAGRPAGKQYEHLGWPVVQHQCKYRLMLLYLGSNRAEKKVLILG